MTTGTENNIAINVGRILTWLQTGYATDQQEVPNLDEVIKGIADGIDTNSVINSAAVLTGVTPGTVTVSKALIVDANKDLSTLRNLGMTGALTFDILGSIAAGVVSSANDTSGVHLNTAKTKVVGINADTGGVGLSVDGNYRAAEFRFLIGTAIASGNISTYGSQGHLKMIANVNTGGNQAGALGHLESAGVITMTGSINLVKAGFASFVDLATGAVIAAGTVVSAFGVNPANFTGVTVNGRLALMHVTAPAGAFWGSLFDISGLNGLAVAAAGATQDLHGIIYYNGVKYTFPLYRA